MGPCHGIEQATREVLLIKEWVRADWEVSDNSRRAKFYALTAAGREQRRTETPTWPRDADAIARSTPVAPTQRFRAPPCLTAVRA